MPISRRSIAFALSVTALACGGAPAGASADIREWALDGRADPFGPDFSGQQGSERNRDLLLGKDVGPLKTPKAYLDDALADALERTQRLIDAGVREESWDGSNGLDLVVELLENERMNLVFDERHDPYASLGQVGGLAGGGLADQEALAVLGGDTGSGETDPLDVFADRGPATDDGHGWSTWGDTSTDPTTSDEEALDVWGDRGSTGGQDEGGDTDGGQDEAGQDTGGDTGEGDGTGHDTGGQDGTGDSGEGTGGDGSGEGGSEDSSTDEGSADGCEGDDCAEEGDDTASYPNPEGDPIGCSVGPACAPVASRYEQVSRPGDEVVQRLFTDDEDIIDGPGGPVVNPGDARGFTPDEDGGPAPMPVDPDDLPRPGGSGGPVDPEDERGLTVDPSGDGAPIGPPVLPTAVRAGRR